MKEIELMRSYLKKKPWMKSVILVGFSALITFLFAVSSGSRHDDGEIQEAVDMTTFIPTGFSLVHIVVQNPEALDSMIGRFGVVDLYLPGRQDAFAQGIRLLRMPGNPLQFGVLVPESETPRVIAANQEPFRVTLQSKEKSMKFAAPQFKPRHIIVEE